MSTLSKQPNTDIAARDDENVTTVESVKRVSKSNENDVNGFNDELMQLVFAKHVLCGDGSDVSIRDTAASLVIKHMRYVDGSNCGYSLPVEKLDTLYAIVDNNTIVRDRNGNWINTYSHYFDRKLNAVIVIDPLLCDGKRYTVTTIYIPYGHDGATVMNRVVEHLQLRASPIV